MLMSCSLSLAFSANGQTIVWRENVPINGLSGGTFVIDA
jgi:hypothetical protein